eukprot:COSAG01_NODE_23804_length_801_cov_1.139601_1_plen_86_part_10
MVSGLVMLQACDGTIGGGEGGGGKGCCGGGRCEIEPLVHMDPAAISLYGSSLPLVVRLSFCLCLVFSLSLSLSLYLSLSLSLSLSL